MRRKTSQGIAFIAALLLIACQKPELTAAKAESILRQYLPSHEPVYAEVPQKVSFGPKSPEDDFDAKSVRTLQNLEREGYITLGEAHDADGTTTYIAHVTAKGFPLLGTAPSYRGPCFRGQICEKKYDGIRNFQRHPTDPTIGHAELIWHYANPTPLYPLFETKMNKPLNKPFASLVAFYYKNLEWKFDVTVRKTDTE